MKLSRNGLQITYAQIPGWQTRRGANLKIQNLISHRCDLLEVNLIVPIPPYTCYLAGTASADQPIQPEFSIDGGSKYQPEPVKYMVKQADGTEKEEIATPDMYTHVRWPAGVMKARQEIVVKCRVQVK